MTEDAVSALPGSTLSGHRLDNLDRQTLNGEGVI
jgi:hypothetical protein